MKPMKHILIIAFSNLESDPRVNRQIRHLKQFYKISTIGLKPAGMEEVEFYPISSQPRSRLTRLWRALNYKLHRFESLYWSLFEFQPVLDSLAGQSFDLILTNDIETLPFALKIAEPNQTKVLFDVHEYAPRQFEDRFIWRFFFQGFNHYLCKTYMKKCAAVTTVSSGLAEEYDREYGIKTEVITNATKYFDLTPSPVDENNIRLITHGITNPNRRIELMIKTMDMVDSRFHLDLMLMPTHPGYYNKLKIMAEARENVTLIPPVKREEIVPVTNHYDLSFMLFKPYTINFKYGLFNKFFESLQARLGIISGPTPVPSARIIKQFDCGVVTQTFKLREFADRINQLTVQQIETFKQNAHIAAPEFTSQKNLEKLQEIVARLI
jgi:hypothetical protein